MACWCDTLFQLIERTSTDIPADVEKALRRGLQAEAAGSNAAQTLTAILDNIQAARERRLPICQDTGSLLFWVNAPYPGPSRRMFAKAAQEAIRRAVDAGILRPNAVDPVTGADAGTSCGPGYPVVHWEETAADKIAVSLLLKGGGSENVSTQYALPCPELAASRNLDGVRRCLLHAVQQAQGMGCAPGILGVAIGGDRGSGFTESKRQLLRPLSVRSAVPELAALESRVLVEANSLGIGPMGFGGETTLLGVAIGALLRVPASYFVSVSYMCWACRHQELETDTEGCFRRWLS